MNLYRIEDGLVNIMVSVGRKVLESLDCYFT